MADYRVSMEDIDFVYHYIDFAGVFAAEADTLSAMQKIAPKFERNEIFYEIFMNIQFS